MTTQGVPNLRTGWALLSLQDTTARSGCLLVHGSIVNIRIKIRNKSLAVRIQGYLGQILNAIYQATLQPPQSPDEDSLSLAGQQHPPRKSMTCDMRSVMHQGFRIKLSGNPKGHNVLLRPFPLSRGARACCKPGWEVSELESLGTLCVGRQKYLSVIEKLTHFTD